MDNKNSYTYQRYRKNKTIIRIIEIATGIIGLFIIIRLLPHLTTQTQLIVIFSLIIILKVIDTITLDERRYNYLTWGRGAGAELKEGRSLEKLGPDYKIINDIQTGQGNIDHLCVGPSGIFVIEIKAHTGTVSYTDRLLINGTEPEKDFLTQVHGEINYVRDLLQQKLNHNYPVVGILEFTNTRQIDKSIYGPKQGVWIGGTGFTNWVIKHKSNPLKVEEIEAITTTLQAK